MQASNPPSRILDRPAYDYAMGGIRLFMALNLTAADNEKASVDDGAMEQTASATITPVASLAEVLRSTLTAIECSEALRPDDPALAELKHSVLRLVAELEVLKAEPLTASEVEPA
jgi:hypothetical protein